jgi:hypothetical protein
MMGGVRARLVGTAILVGVGTMAGACGAPAPGAGTAFCRDVVSVAAGIRSSGSSSEVSFLITHETTVEGLGAEAPRVVKRDVQTFLTGANAAVAQSNAALANTPSIAGAAGRIKAYCGITG